MYNHKLRGRPDEPRNRAIAAAEKSLALTIQVNSLRPLGSPLQPSDLEIARSRQHYNEFRKSYALKHSNLSLRVPNPKAPIVKEVGHTEVFKLDKAFAKTPPPPPINTVSLHTIYSKQNMQESMEDVNALMLLEKLKAMADSSSRIAKQSQQSQVSQLSQNAATQSALVQAEKEVMVAQNQLKAIQNLLKVDKATSRPAVSLSTIEEEEELHPRTRQKKIVDDVKGKIDDAKQKNMAITLNTLNKRIQQMHEKYFNEPRHKYLTLKEVKRRVKVEKNIKVLYRNEGFDPEKEISEIMLQQQAGTLSVPETTEAYPEVVHQPKAVSVIRKAASIPLQKHMFTADISSDNYLQNKTLHSDHIKDKRSTRPSYAEIKSISASDTDSWENDSRQTMTGTAPATRYMSANVDVIMSPKASIAMSNSDSTLHSIQDSILRSEYLMKEFDLTPSDLSTGLSNFESSQSVSRRRSVPKQSYPSIQEFFSATNVSEERVAGMQRAFMEDSIRTQLKNSLYDIF